MTVPRPDLSVIITSYNARPTIAACLDSLRAQATSLAFEILLVDSSADGTVAFVREEYPEVVVLSSPERLFAGSARNLAIPHARATLIAFLDADCTVDAGWVEAVCAAHEGPDLLMGGTVDNAPTRSLVAWAYYFCEFNLWLPAARGRTMSEAAGCCLSMKREAYDRYGPFFEATYSSDTAFQWRARRDGQRVQYTPSIRVIHQSPTGLRHFLQHTAEHRHGYARVKCLDRRLSTAGRRLEMALLTVTPVLLLGATLVRLRVCPRYLPRFLAASPLVFLGYAARSWGEFTGYLKGRDDLRSDPSDDDNSVGSSS